MNNLNKDTFNNGRYEGNHNYHENIPSHTHIHTLEK